MSEDSNRFPVILTIAGFDPSGGAGIIADVKTILNCDCQPVAAITSLTFQNAEEVFGATHESAGSVRAQILPILEEQSISAIKTGLLPTREIVNEVAWLVQAMNLPAPVVDPVLRSSSGYRLMEDEAVESLVEELFPLARLVTPNIPEAETLAGMTITDEPSMREAAQRLRHLGARAVLIKGGHLPARSEVRTQEPEQINRSAIDLLDDNGVVTIYRGDWIDAPPVRGTGCMLSSAIAACLGKRLTLKESVQFAKEFVADAFRNQPEVGSQAKVTS